MINTPVHPPAGINADPGSVTPVLRFRERVRMRSGEQDLLVVRVGRERFALPLEAVEELVESPQARPVPGGPDGLLGVMAAGSRLLPLYSPGTLLGTSPAAEPVALVMLAGNRRIALAVDDADDVIHVDLAEVREPPRTGRDDDLVIGVLWREGTLTTVLDPRALSAACMALGGVGQ